MQCPHSAMARDPRHEPGESRRVLSGSGQARLRSVFVPESAQIEIVLDRSNAALDAAPRRQVRRAECARPMPRALARLRNELSRHTACRRRARGLRPREEPVTIATTNLASATRYDLPPRLASPLRLADTPAAGVDISVYDDLAAAEAIWRAFQRTADCTAFQT